MAEQPKTTGTILRTRWVLGAHTAAYVLWQSVAFGVWFIVPYLARREFGAQDWGTVLITAAGPTFLAFSIFWNELLVRRSLRQYLLILWLVAALPLALMAFAQSYWHLLALHVISAVGGAGATPLMGELLKRFYADGVRGRVYGVLNMAGALGGAGLCYAAGRWMNTNPAAFRIFMPLAAVLQLASVVIFIWLDTVTRPTQRAAAATRDERHRLSALLQPVFHMGAILRRDRKFFRYEAAFMTYGVGWMVCHALLPVLADKRLGMTYEQYAGTTQVAWQTVFVLTIIPMGWLLDRVGAARTCALSFGWLMLYPLLLMNSTQPGHVAFACAVYGIGISGVHQGWMLGPVSFAPSPEKVPQYVSIHTTLVGIRGVLFQGMGMLVYTLTGGFVVPFVIAAIAFAAASWQMWLLREKGRGASVVSQD